MKKSTKGALAAGAAASLLLGGAGSLAYWTSTGTIDGTSITSGHLKLAQSPTNCDTDWTLTGAGQTTGAALTAGDVLSPGDVLTKHCSYTVSMDGKNLKADLAVSAPGFASGAGALRNDMTVDGAFSYDADGAGAGPSAPVTTGSVANIANASTIDATITVAFKNSGVKNNASNTGANLAAVLDDVTVTATQQH